MRAKEFWIENGYWCMQCTPRAFVRTGHRVLEIRRRRERGRKRDVMTGCALTSTESSQADVTSDHISSSQPPSSHLSLSLSIMYSRHNKKPCQSPRTWYSSKTTIYNHMHSQTATWVFTCNDTRYQILYSLCIWGKTSLEQNVTLFDTRVKSKWYQPNIFKVVSHQLLWLLTHFRQHIWIKLWQDKKRLKRLSILTFYMMPHLFWNWGCWVTDCCCKYFGLSMYISCAKPCSSLLSASVVCLLVRISHINPKAGAESAFLQIKRARSTNVLDSSV